MSKLRGHLQRQEREELARAIRELLAAPFLTGDDAVFDIVRRRRDRLAEWFDRNCGWRLYVDTRQGYARLAKVVPEPDATRPARRDRSTRAPFDRRRYALLCVVAAELLGAPATTIGLLSARVIEATAADEQIPTFDPTRREERGAYVDAIKFLERHQALKAVDGTTDSYLDSAEVKVLYRVDTGRLLRLLAAPVPPSRLAGPDLDELLAEHRYGAAGDPESDVSEQQRNLWLRHSVTRRLLDDPVVYHDDLTDAQRAYLGTITGRRVIRQAAEEAGFVLEERAEGLLVIDPDAIATDEKFPDERNHAKHAALLLLDRLARGPMTQDEVTEHVTELLGRFPAWAKSYQSEGGPRRLAGDALAVLRAFGLAEVGAAGVRALPAAARYAVAGPPELAGQPGAGQPGAGQPGTGSP
ncbi:MAG TPA: TIGR02678 family protein [Streptosporangiaceae bacterium]